MKPNVCVHTVTCHCTTLLPSMLRPTTVYCNVVTRNSRRVLTVIHGDRPPSFQEPVCFLLKERLAEIGLIPHTL